MISASTAAGLIFGNLQCNKCLNQQIDSLPDEEAKKLTAEWERLISDSPNTAARGIIASVAVHPHLMVAWQRVGSNGHAIYAHVFQTIIDNTNVA